MHPTSALRVRRMARCALFAALTAVCSQLALPTPWGVPVDLALFAVYLAGVMQGPLWGAASQGVFLLLAAVGLPVMAGLRGGPAAVFGITGGYALGYLAAAAIPGALCTRRRSTVWLCGAMALGCAACYLFGSVWCAALTGADLLTTLALYVLPYLPGDAAKIALAAALARALDERLPQGGRL